MSQFVCNVYRVIVLNASHSQPASQPVDESFHSSISPFFIQTITPAGIGQHITEGFTMRRIVRMRMQCKCWPTRPGCCCKPRRHLAHKSIALHRKATHKTNMHAYTINASDIASASLCMPLRTESTPPTRPHTGTDFLYPMPVRTVLYMTYNGRHT